MSSLLIPTDTAQVKSWRSHYFAVRVRIFALALATLAAMVLCTVVLLEHPVYHPRRIIPISLAILFTAGLVSENPRLHAAICVVVSVMVGIIAVAFMGPTTFSVVP